MFQLHIKFLFIACGIFFFACSKNSDTKTNQSIKNVYIGRGIACWYGKDFDGKKTSSGEIFDRNKLTAAHRKLEFGTILKVTNETNDKSVKVLINDRGPFSKNRVLDLSEKAAKEIDLFDAGFGSVKMEICGYQKVNFKSLLKHFKNIQTVKYKYIKNK